MQIFVKSQTLELHNVCENDTVATLRQQYGQDAALFVCGMPLEDNMLISEHVAELGTVEVSMRLLGGKVHGSLARAGKVKGQTPKVEKAEKKKKRTGRAKRRVQYNRRFVNTVAGFGRKKGPNSQSTA